MRLGVSLLKSDKNGSSFCVQFVFLYRALASLRLEAWCVLDVVELASLWCTAGGLIQVSALTALGLCCCARAHSGCGVQA